MLKVAPCTVVRSYGRTVVHPNFFRLDGLLLFCIIMGLRSASSASIVRQILTGQSLVDFYFLSKKWSIGITNTIVRPIQIVESVVDFDCVSNIN